MAKILADDYCFFLLFILSELVLSEVEVAEEPSTSARTANNEMDEVVFVTRRSEPLTIDKISALSLTGVAVLTHIR